MSPEISARRQMIKNKILAVGRLQRVFNVLREEAEGASELAHAGHNGQGPPVPGAPGTLGVRLGADALGIHDNQWVRSFDEARRSDMGNERLPKFVPAGSQDPLVTAPSMRQEGREELLKKALEEDKDGDGAVERLADRIARGKKQQPRPARALKRYETA